MIYIIFVMLVCLWSYGLGSLIFDLMKGPL